MTQDELVEFLDSERNEHGLDSVATHGFLTATVVGKPLENWQSHLFEGQEKQVSDSVLQALQQWQQSISHELKEEDGVELPFADGTEEVDFSPESDLAAWSVGFVDAMYADEGVDWFDDEQTEEDVAMLTLPMVVFSGINEESEEEDEVLASISNDEDTLAQMANSIEANVIELFLLFHTEE